MRQKPIGDYIVDFFCSKLRLVIEIDGESHDGRFCYDAERQKFLESMSLSVLRFNDADVKKDITNVLMAIEGWVENKLKQPPSSPFVKGEFVTMLPHEQADPLCAPFGKGEFIAKDRKFNGY